MDALKIDKYFDAFWIFTGAVLFFVLYCKCCSPLPFLAREDSLCSFPETLAESKRNKNNNNNTKTKNCQAIA